MTLFTLSCKNKNQKKFLIINPSPIFSETDSFLSSTNYLEHNKDDYFLVKTNIEDKSLLVKTVDSFVNKNHSKYGTTYDNYTMFFYKESEDVNKEILLKFPRLEYKIFLDAPNDLINSYLFYILNDSVPSIQK